MKLYATISAAVAGAARTAQAPLTWDPVNHLLSRCTFGPSVAARADVAAQGWDGWLTDQLALARRYSGYSGVAQTSTLGPYVQMSPYDVNSAMTARGRQFNWDAMDQLSDVTAALQLYSPAQLYEVMVDFFANHLNVPNHAGDVWNTRPAYDRQVIRPNALGSFTAMLKASCKHPAMLQYLSLQASTKNTLNENYGREVLELHTVGLNYTESDVQNTARLLTGRTVDSYGHYSFDPDIHTTGPISVLGFTNANSSAAAGETAGDALLAYLASHPDTAQHLAAKLCVRLVSDNPSAELVAAVAKAYLASGTQIVPMVRTILRSDEFWSSRGQKVRRPTENLFATIRILNPQVTDWSLAMQQLRWWTQQLGNRPLDWPAPNGYPDVAAAWRSSGAMLLLWNYHLSLAGGWASGFGAPDLSASYGSTTPATSGQAIAALAKGLTGMSFSADHLAALQTFLAEPAATPMASSRLRWQTPNLVAAILHGPHHALR